MSNAVESSPWSSSRSTRSCWVCFGTDLEDECRTTRWVHPCKCKGSMRWVHESCLQRWIDEKQRRTRKSIIACSHCKKKYKLYFPDSGIFVKLLEKYDNFLYLACPYVAITAFFGSAYYCLGSYGFLSVIQVMGYDDGRRLIDETDPFLLFVGLPTIPIVLFLSKMIKWESFILRMWKERAYKLPAPISYFIGEPPINGRLSGDSLLAEPGLNDALSNTRLVCGALLLPTVSTIVGEIFFSFLSGPQWRKSVFGGLSFILVKGALRIYLKKSLYIRNSLRAVKNYQSSRDRTHIEEFFESVEEGGNRMLDEIRDQSSIIEESRS